jgi:hypothetical protein
VSGLLSRRQYDEPVAKKISFRRRSIAQPPFAEKQAKALYQEDKPSFSVFSQSNCFRPHSSCQRACFFRLIGEGIVLDNAFSVPLISDRLHAA